jgi:hypothetical protein
MMPYQTYQLYAIERPRSAAEMRRADEQAGRIAAAVAGILRRLAIAPRPRGAQHDRELDRAPADICGRITTTMEVR